MINDLASVFSYALGGCRVIRRSADASARHGTARLSTDEIGQLVAAVEQFYKLAAKRGVNFVKTRVDQPEK
jgi:hypothetical protein